MKIVVLIVAAALNPLVVRAPEPLGPVPAECTVSGAVPVARVPAPPPEEALPLPMVRPAGATTGDAGVELNRALANNDRAAFDAALARARAAGTATRVYEDIARLWDAQFASPFFGQDSEEYRVASSYPGYEAAVRRQILTDGAGRKFYPAAESRAFVAQQAGVKKPQATTRRAEARPSSRQTTTSAPRRSSTPRRTSPAKPHTTTAAAHTTPAKPPVSPPQVAAAVPAPAATQTVPAAASDTPPTVPEEATSEPAAATAIDTAASTTTASLTPAETVTASPLPAAPVPGQKRSLVLPVVLILLGVGVLILLFRTAS